MQLRITVLFLSIFFICNSCIDAIEPEFDFNDKLLFIDAFALSEPGFSYVSIKESFTINDGIAFRELGDALVQFENTEDGRIILLPYDSIGIYKPNLDFIVLPNEKWRLFIELGDGRKYVSTTESVPGNVAIKNVSQQFEEELTFSLGSSDFVPGHSVSLDFQDPAGKQNFYMWKHRTFESQITCKTCLGGIWRNNTCVPLNNQPPWAPKYTDYLCLTDCWKMRFGDNIPVYSDEFTDGEMINNKRIADIIFYRNQSILVEIQQFSINQSTYDYFKKINNLIEESGGINAPTPSALLGNLTNPDDTQDVVLGQFTAASIKTSRIFIDRNGLPVQAQDPDPNIRLETCIGCPTTFACLESQTRTAVKPFGWPE